MVNKCSSIGEIAVKLLIGSFGVLNNDLLLVAVTATQSNIDNLISSLGTCFRTEKREESQCPQWTCELYCRQTWASLDISKTHKHHPLEVRSNNYARRLHILG